MARPTALMRSSFHEDAWIRAMLSSEASGEAPRDPQHKQHAAQQHRLEHQRPGAQHNREKLEQSTSLSSIAPQFTVKGISPLLMCPSEASTFHSNLYAPGFRPAA